MLMNIQYENCRIRCKARSIPCDNGLVAGRRTRGWRNTVTVAAIASNVLRCRVFLGDAVLPQSAY